MRLWIQNHELLVAFALLLTPFLVLCFGRGIIGASWRTSLFGMISMAWGIWNGIWDYVPHATLKFNLTHALRISELFILVGIVALFTRDHKVSSEDAGVKRKE